MKSLFKTFFGFSIGPWLSAIISFIATPIITWLIVPEEFGRASMFILANSIISFIVLFGLDSSYMRYSIDIDDETKRKIIFKSILLNIFLIIILYIIIYIYWNVFSNLLFQNNNIIYFVLLFVANSFTVLYRYGFIVLRMKKQALKCSIISVFQVIVQSLLTIILAVFWRKIFIVICIGYIGSMSIAFFLSIIFMKEFWFADNSKKGKRDINIWHYFLYGIPFMPTHIIFIIFESMDKMALRNWTDFSTIGVYAAAFKLVGILKIIQRSFQTFWIPVAYDKYKEDPDDKQFFIKIFDIMFIVMFLISVVFLAFKDIVILILGEGYHGASMILPFLILVPLMSTISEVTSIGINIKKKTGWHIFISIIITIINLIGNILLVPFIGAKGAAISTGISYIVYFILKTTFSQKYFNIKFNFKKTTFILLLFLGYVFISTFIEFYWYHVLYSVALTCLGIVLYKKQISNITQSLVNLIKKGSLSPRAILNRLK
ncbi:MAG: polysaccharide biosynthesis C-terminal domain-containing protein [Spirochaetales bacterium]|nr:polysaccharide biosynthesis C-terminal domain-containing protein [Spirochaetales bacterium]